MSTNLKDTLICKRTCCAVCDSSRMERVIELPGLPLTGLFSRKAAESPTATFDQSLLICSKCGHGQLEFQIAPEHIYDDTYSFRTSMSATATSGTEFFINSLNSIAGDRTFRCIIDVGCNDLHLLSRLKGRAPHRIGIDPIWKGRENESADKSLRVLGKTVEDVLESELPGKPNLVLCRHTLEHIYEPSVVVRQLMDIASEDALFVFEVPGVDALIRKYRFDHVFHQHLQYFNLHSFCSLLNRVNARYIAYRENYHDWGAILVAFGKEHAAGGKNNFTSPFPVKEIRRRYNVFQAQLQTVRGMALELKENCYGFGAAQMLPILAYHMKTDLSFLRGVLDDDPHKKGLYYQNLPLKIQGSSVIDNWGETNIFLTAVDNSKPILTRLLSQNRPKHILHPFHFV